MEKMPIREKIIVTGLSASILAWTIYIGKQIQQVREETKAKVAYCLEHKEDDTKCENVLKSTEWKKIVIETIENNYWEEKLFSNKINNVLNDVKDQLENSDETIKKRIEEEEKQKLEIEEVKARAAGEPTRLCESESDEFCEEDWF